MDSIPLSRAVNSQPAGIGRIVSLGSRCAWNNLGRNVVFADASLRPIAIFGDTMFPEDDEASQFDLDIHAIVELADTGQIAVLNHLGVCSDLRATTVHRIRARRRTPPQRDSAARLCRRRREGDRPRRPPCDVTAPRSAPGRSAGDPADRLLRPVPRREHCTRILRLRHRSRGELNAGGTGWVALGGEGRVRLVEVDHGRLGATRWEAAVDFRPCRAGGMWVLPSGLRAAPWTAPDSTTTTGSNYGEEGLPSST